MTALEFNTALSVTGNTIQISDQEIVGALVVNSRLRSTGVIVKNCTFKETVIFDSVDLNYGIIFQECKFEKSLSINNCRASNFDQVFNLDGYHIIFSKVIIKRGLHFNGNNQIDRGVKIDSGSNISSLKVDRIITKSGSFSIQDSTIEQELDFFNSKFIGTLDISNNSTIKSKVRFQNIIATSINFIKSNFEKDVHIWSGEIRSLVFNDGIFNDTIYISALPITDRLTISGTEFKKTMIFTIYDSTNKLSGSIDKIYIASCKFGQRFIINGNSTVISDFDLILSTQLEGTLDFNHCELMNTTISGSNFKSNINFKYCNFKKLTLHFLYNYSTISIMSGKAYDKDSEITIADSNLGKMQFLNMFFDTFKKIDIYNSILTEIITTNVKWFNPENLNQLFAIDSFEFSQKREVFRQLKYVLEKQGNKIESLKFKSLEIKLYKQEQFSQHKWWKRILNNDRFILWIGWTNDFGQNWIRPVILIISFVFVFYCLMVIGISDKLSFYPNFTLESIKVTYSEIVKYIQSYPQLLNPVHVLDKVFPDVKNFGFWIHSIDYMIRIFLAFFIFQIISAFRKFAK